MPIRPVNIIQRVTTTPKVYDLVANTDVALEGGFDDWPAQVQDTIMAALERLATREQCPVTILSAAFGVDTDTGPFLHVIAGEIVMGTDPDDAAKRLMEELRRKTQ